MKLYLPMLVLTLWALASSICSEPVLDVMFGVLAIGALALHISEQIRRFHDL